MDKKYFSTPGDLTENPFKKLGDLDVAHSDKPINSGDNFFKTPEDISTPSKKEATPTNNVKDYLITIVSGKKYDAECELGILVGGGNIIVDFKRLQEMVDLGMNIISAKYINDNMIAIEFQEFRQDNKKERGR